MKTLLAVLFVFFLLPFITKINAKIIYFDPVKNAKYVSINNNIIIGFDDRIESSDLSSLISVVGSISGKHTGEIILTPDGKKLMFKPYQSFAFNEQVVVTVNHLKTSSIANNKLNYTFQTQVIKLPVNNADYDDEEAANSSNKNFPSSDNLLDALPPLTVTISNNPSPGHLFMNNGQPNNGYTAHLIIANNDGTTLYTRELLTVLDGVGMDFKRQPNGLLTYRANTIFYGETTEHVRVDSFYCGNGYVTGGHELRVLNNGHALLTSYDPEPVDMSLIVTGGDPNAIVTGLIIQEIDENKNVVFQWRSWDHFAITDAEFVNLLAPTIDYVHGNAIEFDTDGNLMISSRHLSEITKINRSTGDIIWRMGGLHNQFTFVNDTIPFRYQHNIRRIANGNVTLFDNGNFRTPSFSRALEYHLDEVNKVATLVWSYINNPVIYGSSQGCVQRLQNGNTLICWGAAHPNITEVTPNGNIALEMAFPVGVVTYRTYFDEVHVTLNSKLIIEGFYNTLTNKMNTKDKVTLYLRNVSSPYGIVDSSTAVIDSVNMTGNFSFYNASTGTYYITTKHRNSVETWSKSGGQSFNFGHVYSYDFTSSSSQAYGNNLIQKGSKYCLYSGDVNQDGFVDLTDGGLIDSDLQNFETGYLSTDLTGDGFVDINDASLEDNNSFNFVGAITP
jgi:Arylsulfotransferase (ASST)/Bacterial Ig-like domain